VRLKVFTVPGQVIHASTRRLVVQGADGVAFIADSRRSETGNNAESFVDLRRNLDAQGIALERMPLVIQFNKRDLPEVRSEAEIAEMARHGKEPVYLAVATKGQGVVECFIGLLHLTWMNLEAEHQLARKFGFDGEGFIHRVAAKLGFHGSVESLLSRSLGGKKSVAQEAVS
jgi:signal recognition particle receptor subunit beta